MGRRLREIRKEKRVSLGVLAKGAGYTKGYLSKIESGEKPLTAEAARACDRALATGGELTRLVNLRTAARYSDSTPAATTSPLSDQAAVRSEVGPRGRALRPRRTEQPSRTADERVSDSSAERLVVLYERLTRALEAQAELEQVRNRSQQLTFMLLFLIGHLQRRITDLVEVRDGLAVAKADTSVLHQVGLGLTRAEYQQDRAQVELARARTRLVRAETIATHLRKRIEDLRRAAGEVPEELAGPAVPATDTGFVEFGATTSMAAEDDIDLGLARLAVVSDKDAVTLERLADDLSDNDSASAIHPAHKVGPRSAWRLWLTAAAAAAALASATVGGYILAAADGQGDAEAGQRTSFPVQGIDVSRHQGNLEWKKLAAAQQFVLIKASQGTHLVDDRLRTNMEGARSAGIIRSAYHYLSLDADGKTQAKHFLATAHAVGYTGTGPGELPPILILDDGGMCQPEDAGKLLRGILDYLETVQQATQEAPIVYFMEAFRHRCLNDTTALARYPRWLAYFRDTPPKTNDWLFWQHTDIQPTRGANTVVSSSVFHDDYTALRRRAHFD
ncbi:GH25 family lysozyme [Streptomyces justiciae]|nr:GH25 family lysozyme [Streptomyces justiciae]